MTSMEVIKKAAITFAELRKELKSIKKRDGQLSFRANKTEEYLDAFTKISTKDVKEIKDEIEKLKLTRLKENHIAKLIDLMPKTVSEAKIILQGYSLSIKNEELKKIVDIIKKRIPKKK